MKITHYIGVLFALILFSSCEIEPFESNIISESDDMNILPPDTETESEDTENNEDDTSSEIPFSTGQLRFEIENRSFLSIQNNGTINNDLTTIVGIDNISGERVNISFIGASSGTYSLDDINVGIYFPDFQQRGFSTAVNGGSGSLIITSFDIQNNQIAGSFQFTGYREQQDEDGNSVWDLEGNPVFEVMELHMGEFEMIPLN